jgi:hypothetical protein
MGWGRRVKRGSEGRMGEKSGRMRPVPRPAEVDQAAATVQRVAREQRGREELFDVRREGGLPFLAFRVSNPLRGTRYAVYWPTGTAEGPWSCDCADFAHRGLGFCKHIEAARIWALEHADELRSEPAGAPPARPAVSLWEELDRRWAGLPTTDRVSLSTLRWAEPVLLEGS